MSTPSSILANALRANRPANAGGGFTDGRTIYLHGSPIVRNTDTEGLQINLAGVPTPTTRRYINAALEAFGVEARVFQLRDELYLGTGENNKQDILRNGWTPVAFKRAEPVRVRSVPSAR